MRPLSGGLMMGAVALITVWGFSFWPVVGACFVLWLAWLVWRGTPLQRLRLMIADTTPDPEMAQLVLERVYEARPELRSDIIQRLVALSHQECLNLLETGLIDDGQMALIESLRLLQAGRLEGTKAIIRWRRACEHEGMFDDKALREDVSMLRQEFVPSEEGV